VTDVFRLPTPQEVGAFYDETNELIALFQGGNMHYGYWTGPDDDSDFVVAGQRLTDIVIGRLGVKPGERVLDVGCGPGKPGVHLAKTTGAQLVGISISARDVELANARAAAEGVADRARFSHADATAMPFEAESFDAVLLLESIVHMPDRAQVLGEVSRVLKPGGRAVLTDFVRRGEHIEVDKETQEAVAAALWAWRAAPMVRAEEYPGFAEQAGLVIDEIEDITAQTMYTYPRTYVAMAEYAKTHEDLPADLRRILEMGLEDDWEVDPADVSEGVLIVTLHRP
jgi:ubiquinone/menaquinone biosynthesis C-methylase UbiE